MFQRHLLLIAHGSRLAAANAEVKRLARRLAALSGGQFAAVGWGFLESAAPSVAETLAKSAAEGAREIVIVPYFLAAGAHVTHDLPQAIAAFRAAYPHVRVHLAPHLGAAERLPSLLLALAVNACSPANASPDRGAE